MSRKKMTCGRLVTAIASAALTGTLAVQLALPATAPAKVATAKFNPANFAPHNVIDNQEFPLIPGTVYTYKGVKDGKKGTDVLEVTRERATIDGVSTTVIHDQLTQGGKIREHTVDWYAQDMKGNVWYLGEETETRKANGELESTEGSWQAGAPTGAGKIAQPGIFMPAKPRVGFGFKQELAAPVAEDQFEVLSLHSKVSVPYVTSRNALRTKETTPLEPGVVDNKLYIEGIGTVLEKAVKGPTEFFELVELKRP
jgi:hypothetical protein